MATSNDHSAAFQTALATCSTCDQTMVGNAKFLECGHWCCFKCLDQGKQLQGRFMRSDSISITCNVCNRSSKISKKGLRQLQPFKVRDHAKTCMKIAEKQGFVIVKLPVCSKPGHTKFVSTWCETCTDYICVDCLNQQHNNHDLLSFAEMHAKVKYKLKECKSIKEESYRELQNSNKKIRDLEGRLEIRDTETSRLKKHSDYQRKRVENLEKMKEESDNALQIVSLKLQDFQTRLQQNDLETSNIRELSDTQTTVIETFKTMNEQSKKQIQRTDKIDIRLEQMIMRLSELKTKLNTEIEDISAIQESNSGLHKAAEKIQHFEKVSLKQMNVEMGSLRQLFEAKNKEIEHLKRMKEESDSKLQVATKRTLDLERSLQEVEMELSRLNQRSNTQTRDIENIQKKLEMANQRIQDLERKVKKLSRNKETCV